MKPDKLHADIATIIDAPAPGAARCQLVLYAEYRLDLARQLADETGLAFRDFRREVLSGQGKRAHEQPLTLLDQDLSAHGRLTGTVIANVEALLATRPVDERRHWFADVLDRRFDYPLLLPLTLFADEAPTDHPGVIDLRERALPPQSLISRLALSGAARG